MTLKNLLITGIACTLIAGQSYAQESQTENENTLNNNVEQNKSGGAYIKLGDIKGESTKSATPFIKLGDIKGESTKRVSDDDCDDTDADCKSVKTRPGTDGKAPDINITPPQ